MKRWMICLLVLTMAGIANAEVTTVWNPAANGITPPAVGYFDTGANWTTGTPGAPPASDKAVFNVVNAAECLVTNALSGFRIVQGDNGAADAGLLRITSTGTITTRSDSWNAVGYNRKAHCIVEAGGLYNIGSRLGVGLVTGGDGFLEVYGDVAITGALQVGLQTKGKVVIYDSGTVTAAYPEMGAVPKSLIDIWGDGVLSYGGERTNQIAGFVADGRIIGNRLTNNVNIAVVVNAGVTNTVITTIPSVPNLEGLSISEVTNVLTAFGYVVGDVTYGFVSGALTDHAIGQDPAAGSAPLNPGDPVDVVLQALSVPNLIGFTFVTASNTLAGMGLTVGTVTTNYVFDETPESVLAQDPAGGAAASPGQAIDLTIMEPLAAQTDIVSVGSGDWMTTAIWSTGIVPERETQGFKVKGLNGTTITLTNKVAVKTLVLGDGGPCQLDIMDGGHFVGGQFGDWNAVGYSAPVTLNVYTGGVFECRKNMLRSHVVGSGLSIMNIDGGTVWIGDWMGIGGTNSTARTETTIKNGGSLTCLRFRDQTTYTNGLITVYDGTFAMLGTGRIADIQWGLDNGIIELAPGYAYTLSNSSGDSVLTGFLPGYASWADSFLPTVIGAENDDYDGDLRKNLYEYGLNGDPTNNLVLGVEPVFTDVGGGAFEYTHLVRNDDPNLVYTVQTKSDLVSGVWTNTGYTVLGTNVTGGAYDEVVNSISTTANEAFIRLKISN